ncbi:MAG: aldo/keto reductase [Silicimonas sp.]|nr:aldo/keto reductase [Silicimonas sp.]
MKTTTLGPGGPPCSRFGVGAMSFAGFYNETSETECHAVLDAAMAAGVTHIDTANVYGMGRSEQIIGTWLAANPSLRHDVTIATKAALTRRDGARVFDNSLQHLEEELDNSLERLGTDYVDLFYVHRLDANRPIEEVAGNLGELVLKGKARTIGFSEIAPTSLRRAVSEHPVAAVQSEYSLATRYPELGLVQTCAELGTALVAFSPVGRSLLTDAPLDPKRVSKIDFLKTNPRFMEPNYSANIAGTAPFRALAADMGFPAAGLAIAWVMAQGDHVIPIPGTGSLAHFKDVVRGADIDLSQDDIARIETVLPVGWAHGDRYTADQWNGPEKYC